MATLTHLNQSLVAAGCVAPASRWSDAAAPAGNHHATVMSPVTATTYEVKPSFKGITRRLTEGST